MSLPETLTTYEIVKQIHLTKDFYPNFLPQLLLHASSPTF